MEFRVLLVEDDDDDQMIIKKMLVGRPSGVDDRLDDSIKWNVDCVESVEGARKYLVESRPNTVLLDLSLPDGMGLDVLKELMKVRKNTDYIILTGHTDYELGLEAMKMGASDFLVKGRFERTSLLKSILFSMERNKLQDEIRKIQKGQTLGVLASGIAHDFNNQLGILMILVEQGRSHNSLSEEFQKVLADMESVIKRCSLMTEQILTYAKDRKKRGEKVNITNYLSKHSEFFRRVLPDDISLEININVKDVMVSIGEGYLDQIIWNLLVNGRDAIGKNGKLNVELDLVPSEKLSLSTWESSPLTGSLAVLTVSDTGGGISQENLSKVFDPFFTTKEENRGTGLGLANIKGILKQSGGYIRVKSELGKGTAFSVYLPVMVNQDEVDMDESCSEQVDVDGKGRSVLLCEDVEMLQTLLASSLESRNFKVIKAKDGYEGLALFKKYQEEIDFVISDLAMPRMSGHELQDELRKLKPSLKFIFMSGNARDYRNDSYKGREEFLGKPFTSEMLIEKIGSLMEGE